MRVAGWLVLAACATTAPPVPAPPGVSLPDAAQRAVVCSFIQATEARRFDEVLGLLARPLRDRYTPGRLEQDFEADPLASARLTQIKLHLDARFEGGTRLPWGQGKRLQLTLEAEGWRIAALE